MLLFIDINITITITFSIVVGVLLGGSVVAHYLKHPDKLEKLISLFNKAFIWLCNSAENRHIKYDIQYNVNSFIIDLYKRIPNLTPTQVKLVWIDENQTAEQFVKSDELVLRMHKSVNQNKNIVNATFAFVSYSLLRKAKKYIAKYQKDSIDLFVSYKMLQKAKSELLDEFVQEYLHEGLEKEKVADFYEKFFDMDKAGVFFPVFISEMTFLGEKVFGKKRDDQKIIEEVTNTINFLYRFAIREYDEQGINEYNGSYCKFSIRIIGKAFKIGTEGEKVYIRNLNKIPEYIETLYLIGNIHNKSFINSVVNKFNCSDKYSVHNKYEYSAKIKGKFKEDFEVNNYLLVLRNNQLELYHRN